jgi:hypothetical protein
MARHDREEEQSLKEREYPDAQGNAHHHSRADTEDHAGERGGRDDRSRK